MVRIFTQLETINRRNCEVYYVQNDGDYATPGDSELNANFGKCLVESGFKHCGTKRIRATQYDYYVRPFFWNK